jgi:cbb3-type cytochrome oxidase subunit 1
MLIGGANWGWGATMLTNEILPIRQGRAIGIEVIGVATFCGVDDNLFDWWLVQAEGAFGAGRVGVFAGVIFSWHGAIPP